MKPDAPVAYAAGHQTEWLSELIDGLRIPSVSTLPERRPDLEAAAHWCERAMRAAGLTRVEAMRDGDSPPLLYGEWQGAPGKPCVLIYGHYDVQPAEPLDLWQTPAFEPTIRDGNLYARGASDDKGQILALLKAVESWSHTDGLPVNIKVLIEGEEEIGSPVLHRFVPAHTGLLAADVGLVSDSSMWGPDRPAVSTSLRGMAYAEVRVRTAESDLHSGMYGGAAPNAFEAAVRIAAGLKGVDGRVTIPGFYDRVRPISDAQRAAIAALPFDEQRFQREEVRSAALPGEPGFSPLERAWLRPTLDFHGITGGFTGHGGKTVIPCFAGLKVSTRLVPDQQPDEIFRLLEARVRELCPAWAVVEEVARLGAADPILISQDTPYVRAASRALEQAFGHAPVPIGMGGSIPVVATFRQSLGIDTVLMGFGLPDDNLHAPNEKLALRNFYAGIEAATRFLGYCAFC